jgi:hypothetical protein
MKTTKVKSRKRSGRCVHCLQNGVQVTDDHVLPESWYPANAPLGVAKWTAPACVVCNGELGAIENDLLIRLSLCIDPEHPTTADIVRRGMRAINPDAGRPGVDERSRAAMLRKMQREARVGPPAALVMPNFEERWGRPPNEQTSIPISRKHLRRFGEKVVRGVHFHHGGRYIEPPLTVDVYPMGQRVAPRILEILGEEPGERFAVEPGIVVKRWVPADDPSWCVYLIDIWSTLKFWASVSTLAATAPKRCRFPVFGTGSR